MDEHGHPLAVVVALGLVGLGVLLVASLRWAVPGRRWVVVMRRGVVRRVRERGPAVVLPVVEEAYVVDAAPFELTVSARGRTCDGADVRLVATVRAQAGPPTVGEEYAEAAQVVAGLVEPTLAAQIGRSELAGLVVGMKGDLPRALSGLAAAAQAGGVLLLDVTPYAVEHLLLSPSAHHQSERPPGREVAVR